MKTKQMFETITEVVSEALTRFRDAADSRFTRLERRLAMLEEVSGIQHKSVTEKSAEVGDVVEWGGARWLCRGAGRWRRVDDERT